MDKGWVEKNIIPESHLPHNVKIIGGNRGNLAPVLIDLHIHMMWDGSLNPVHTSETEVSTLLLYILNIILLFIRENNRLPFRFFENPA